MFQKRTLIVVFMIVALGLAFGTFFFRSNHKSSVKKTEAASNQFVLTSQSDWQAGTNSQTDLTSEAGRVKIDTTSALSWSDKANSPVASIWDFSGYTSFVYGSNVYIIGGFGDPITGGRTDNLAVLKYDTVADSWSTLASMQHSKYLEYGAVLVGSKIYVAGGHIFGMDSENAWESHDDFEIYDILANTWTSGPSLPHTLEGIYMQELNGKIYIFGGMSIYRGTPSCDTQVHTYGDTLIYDISSNLFTTGESMPQAMFGGATGVHGDNIYLFGGQYSDSHINCYPPGGSSGSTTIQSRLDIYNTTTNAWSSGSARYESAYNHIKVGSKEYFVQGSIQSGVYDYSNNTWSDIPNFNVNSVGAYALTADSNYIYVFGGSNSAGGTHTEGYSYRYNIGTNTWTSLAAMLHAREMAGAQIIDNKVNVFLGYNTNLSRLSDWEQRNEVLKLGSATHTTAPTQLDGGTNFWQWQTFTPTQTTPANTSVTYRFRTSTDSNTWTDWVGSIGAVTSRTGDDSNNPTKYRYLQIEATLTNTDGTSTPTIDQYDIGYHTEQKPNKPTAQTAVVQ